MTGFELRQLVDDLGLKHMDLASDLDVCRDTLLKRYKEDEIPSLWLHAAIGLVVSRSFPLLFDIAFSAGICQPEKAPRPGVADAIKQLGISKAEAARELGVDVKTIDNQIKASRIKGVWNMALIGLIMKRQIPNLFGMLHKYGV